MPITQDRMLSVINAAETYANIFKRALALTTEIRDNSATPALRELVERLTALGVDYDKYRDLVDPIPHWFDMIAALFDRVPGEAQMTINHERAHFNQRAKSNLAGRNYRRKQRGETHEKVSQAAPSYDGGGYPEPDWDEITKPNAKE